MAQDTNAIDIRLWFNRFIKKWYWFFISCAIFGLFGLYNYFSTTPEFAVSARVMLRSLDSGSPLEQLGVMQMMGLGGSVQTADEMAVLTSRDIITQVVHDLNLQSLYSKKEGLHWEGQYPSRDLSVEYPDMFLDTTKRSVKISIRVRKNDYVVRVRYGRWNFSRHKVTDLTQPFTTCAGEIRFALHKPLEVGDQYLIKTYSILPAVEMYNKLITAETLKKESNVVEISAITSRPRLVIDFINKEIELYNQNAVVDKNIMASSSAEFVDARLRLIEKELLDAEVEIERYKEKHGIVDLETEAKLYLEEGAEYKKQVAEIETQINLVNYVADFIRDDARSNMLVPANLGIEDVALVHLIDEYNQLVMKKLRVRRTATSDNPVIEQLDAQLVVLRENIITSIISVNNQLVISKNDFERRFGNINQQRYNLPSQERQFIEVLRNKELKEALYLLLYEKREEIALSLASTVTPAKIIATPQMHPDVLNPNLMMIAFLCLIFGMGCPFAGIYLYYLLNNRLTDEQNEFEMKIAVPFAGSLAKNNAGEHISVKEGVNSVSAELFRSLRTTLRFMIPSTQKNPVILVTSSINGEGKSYVATNLAVSLSLLNKKVALVGLDVRKPMLAEYMGLANEGCLTSYLTDESYSMSDLIVPTEFPNLTVLPAGIIPPNPSELLQSDRLDTLFAELRQSFDYIIVDSAPVALVSDTFLLNRLVDMTLYVCRANYTPQNSVDFINQINEQKRLSNIITVLNDVNIDKIGYGYGYGVNTQSGKK